MHCRLATMHYCEKEFEKLLSCGRCKKAFYCSTKCQTRDWKESHKNVCRAVVDNAKPEVKPVVTSKPVTKHKSSEKEEDEDDHDDDDDDLEYTVQTDAEFRLELLSMTKVTNAKILQAMQDSKGDPSKFLPQVIELREEYHRGLLDQMCSRSRVLVAAAARKAARRSAASSEKQEEEKREETKKEEQLEFSAAVSLGQNLMREVIMAFLQRGLSTSASVDQLDIANNHFNVGIVWPRPPAEFKLEDGDLDGFEPAVTKLMDKGFVCVAGLLDDDIASEIHDECKSKYWDCRGTGTMRLATGTVTDGYECWLPFPPRKGTSPMLEHALRILFALPHEFQRNGYPVRLKVPTMAHLGCFMPGSGREAIHLDNMSTSDGGRELTFVFFCSPQWDTRHGGRFRAYMTEDDRPGPHPSVAAEHGGPTRADAKSGADQTCEEEQKDYNSKDFDPDAGTCLVFRSRELCHEVLVASRVQFALTLFVQRAD